MPAASFGRLLDPVVAGVLDVVDHVLELDRHVEVERRLNAARHDLRPSRLGRAADLHRELEGLAVLRAGYADRGQAGLVDFGAEPGVADQVDDGRGVERGGRRGARDAADDGDRVRAGRVAADLHPLGHAVGVDELEHVVIHQERAVAECKPGGRARRDRDGEGRRPVPVLVGVHEEVDALDRHVRQPGDERVAVGEPVPHGDGDIVPCFDAGLLGAEKPLKEIGRHGKVISEQRFADLGRLHCPAGVHSRCLSVVSCQLLMRVPTLFLATEH